MVAASALSACALIVPSNVFRSPSFPDPAACNRQMRFREASGQIELQAAFRQIRPRRKFPRGAATGSARPTASLAASRLSGASRARNVAAPLMSSASTEASMRPGAVARADSSMLADGIDAGAGEVGDREPPKIEPAVLVAALDHDRMRVDAAGAQRVRRERQASSGRSRPTTRPARQAAPPARAPRRDRHGRR